MSLDRTLGFLGFGNMGMAIYKGLIAAGTIRADQALLYDVDAEKLSAADPASRRCDSLADLGAHSSVVLLATKPQDMAAALEQLATVADPDILYISIAAGISIEFIQQRVGRMARVARVMPNTPALLGVGAAGMTFSDSCSADDRLVTTAIFEAIGIAEVVAESQLDAVTALSGSGPAYFFYFVESMVNAAVALGLPEETARRLAIQTALGAGRMLAESGENPSTLRERVTSKGGTTFAALEVFRAHDFHSIVESAMRAAAQRSKELGR